MIQVSSKPTLPMVRNFIILSNRPIGWCIVHQREIPVVEAQEVEIEGARYLGCPHCYRNADRVGAKRVEEKKEPPPSESLFCFFCKAPTTFICPQCDLEMCQEHVKGDLCLFCANMAEEGNEGWKPMGGS